MTNLNWTAGRQLSSLYANNTAISYTYTPGGTRTSKTVGGVKTEYLLDGGLIMQQKTGSKILNFYYDSAGQVVSLGYKASASSAEIFYFVSRNLQGDVVSIYNSSDSSLVGTYTYDSWGRLVDPAVFPVGTTVSGGTGISLASYKGDQIGIMAMNPFRYRGYYYDNETGFYYLNSRYYDPEVKRFINADGLISTGQGVTGYNMFAYCNNNPVNMVDPSGMCSYLGIGSGCQKIDCKNTSCKTSSCYSYQTYNTYTLPAVSDYYTPGASASSASGAPLPAGSYTIRDKLGAGRGHQGYDLYAEYRTPIYATTAGEVTVYKGTLGGYGNLVIIWDGEYEHRYGHMDEIGVTPGRIEAGDPIGFVGRTGNVRGSGYHLHYEVRKGRGGTVVDPGSWIG